MIRWRDEKVVTMAKLVVGQNFKWGKMVYMQWYTTSAAEKFGKEAEASQNDANTFNGKSRYRWK